MKQYQAGFGATNSAALLASIWQLVGLASLLLLSCIHKIE